MNVPTNALLTVFNEWLSTGHHQAIAAGVLMLFALASYGLVRMAIAFWVVAWDDLMRLLGRRPEVADDDESWHEIPLPSWSEINVEAARVIPAYRRTDRRRVIRTGRRP